MDGVKVGPLGAAEDMDSDWPPPGKTMFCVQDHTGDTKHIWDPNMPAEVEGMRAMYNTLKGKGYAAYRVKPDDHGKGEVMAEFDPRAGKVIFSPPLVGG